MAKDYYAILGVSRLASSAAIHSAFRRLARRYHPDAGKEASATKFREALEAYQTLDDPSRRHQHDMDLGKSAEVSSTVAEPLFQDRYSFQKSFTYTQDDLFADLLRWIESEFESM